MAFDDLSQDQANLSVVRWLSQDIGVPGLIGPASSVRTEAAFQLSEAAGSLMISPSATSTALTVLDGDVSTNESPGLLWRTAPPDDIQGAVIAQYMSETLGTQSVAVIHEIGTYGEGLADAFVQNFTGSVTQQSFMNDSERDEAIASIEGVDEVFFISSSKEDIISFFQAASVVPAFESDKHPVGIFLSDAAYYIDIFESAASHSDLFEQVLGSRPYAAPSPVYNSFAAAYATEFEGHNLDSGGYTAQAFDAMWLMLYGSAWSLYQGGNITGLGTARGLRQISSGNPIDIKPSSWTLVLEQFQDAQSINLTGASGELDYDPDTGELTTPIEIWRVESDGQSGFQFVSETVITPQSAEASVELPCHHPLSR